MVHITQKSGSRREGKIFCHTGDWLRIPAMVIIRETLYSAIKPIYAKYK